MTKQEKLHVYFQTKFYVSWLRFLLYVLLFIHYWLNKVPSEDQSFLNSFLNRHLINFKPCFG